MWLWIFLYVYMPPRALVHGFLLKINIAILMCVCYGLYCVFPQMHMLESQPQIHMLESQPMVPQNMIIFGARIFKEVIKVKCGHQGGLMTGVLIRRVD